MESRVTHPRVAEAVALCTALLLSTGCPTSGSTGTRTDSRGVISGNVVLVDIPGLNDMSRVRVDFGRGEGGLTPNPDGYFETSDLEPDVYTVTVTYIGGLTPQASRSAYATAATRAVVRAGASVSVGRIVLERARATVTGRVEAPGGEAGGATVRLDVEQAGVREVRADNGIFTFPDVPVGTHKLSAVSGGLVQMQAAGTCAAEVSVAEEGLPETPLDVGAVTMVRADPALAPGAAGVASTQGSTWFIQRGTTQVTVQPTAPYARQVRAWRRDVATDGGSPAYAPWSGEGLVLQLPVGTSTWAFQFADLCGFESAEYTLTMVRDEVAPSVDYVLMAGGAAFINALQVPISAPAGDDRDGPLQMFVQVCTYTGTDTPDCTDAEPAEQDWIPYERERDVTFDDVEGVKVVEVMVRDGSGNRSPRKSAFTRLDRTAPTDVALAVGSGAALTREPVADVFITATGATRMLLSEDPNFNDVSSQPFARQLRWSFSAGDGQKTLHLRVLDDAGNASGASRQVTLDTQAPSAPVLAAGNAGGYAGSADVPFTLSSTDGDAATLVAMLSGQLVGGDVEFPVGTPPATFRVPGEGAWQVTALLRDAAGNTSTSASVTVRVDTESPVNQAPRVNDGGRYVVSSSGARLHLPCDDTQGGSGIASKAYRIFKPDADGGMPGPEEGWTTAPEVRSSYSVTFPDGQGEYVVETRCTDRADRVSNVESTTVFYDEAPPSVAVVLEPGNNTGLTNRRSAVLRITVTPPGDVAELSISEQDLDCAAANYTAGSGGDVPVTLSESQGPKVLHVCARDAAGNFTPVRVASNAVTLDTVAPSAPSVTLGNGSGLTSVVDAPLTVTADEPPAGLLLVIEGELAMGAGTTPLTMAPSSVRLPGGEGVRSLRFRLQDLAGNLSATVDRSIRLDEYDPDNDIPVVGDGSGFVRGAAGVTTLQVRCQDSGSGLASRSFRVFRGTTSMDPFTTPAELLGVYPLTLTGGEGTYTAETRCTDRAGRVSAVRGTVFTWDATAPSITVEGNPPPRTKVTNNPTVVVRLSGTLSDVADVAVSIADLGDCSTAEFRPYTGDVQFTLPGDGTYTVYACARDRAGNATAARAAAALTVTLDTPAPSAPMVTAGSPAGFALGTSVPITITSMDADVSTMRVRVRGDLDPASVVDVPWSGRPTSVTLLPGEGTKSIRVQVVDAAGNTSPETVVAVRLDLQAPVADAPVVGDGSGYVTALSGNTTLAFNCADSSNGTGISRKSWRIFAGATSMDPFVDGTQVLAMYPVVLAGAQGLFTAEVRCTDGAGRVSNTASRTFTWDATAPSLTVVANPSPLRTPTNFPTFTVRVTSAAMDLAAVAVSTTDLANCSTAQFTPLAGDVSFTVPADGTYTFYACGRDAAGNVTSTRFASSAVVLDRVAPADPSVTLAAYTTANPVAVTLGTTDTDMTGHFVTLSGDLAASQHNVRTAWASRPSMLTLADAANRAAPVTDGEKLFSAQVEDAAGNLSRPVLARVVLDRVPPAVAAVTAPSSLRGTRILPVTITPTTDPRQAPSTMKFWEVAATCDPANHACGTAQAPGAGYVAFYPSTTLTLSEPEGTKRVCWKMCDHAGQSTASATPLVVSLETYRDRPVPTLARVTVRSGGMDTQPTAPGSTLAIPSTTPVTLRVYADTAGTPNPAFAYDTGVTLGGLDVPCTAREIPASTCRAGTPNLDCANWCDITVPATVLARSGTHVLRMATPAPVVGGVTQSVASVLLAVEAPVPVIERLNTRGVIQATTAEGALLPVTFGDGATPALEVCGRDFLENTEFRLGDNPAQVLSIAAPGPGPCSGYAQVARLRVATNNLAPSDLQDAALVATTPPPRGGASSHAFGVNPGTTQCGTTSCSSNLRTTRATLVAGRPEVAQRFQHTGVGADMAMFSVNGGTAIRLLDPSDGRTLVRLPVPTGHGFLAAPLLPGVMPVVQVEEALGRGPQVSVTIYGGQRMLREGPASDTAPWVTVMGNPVAFTSAQLTGDNRSDLVVISSDNLMQVIRSDSAYTEQGNVYQAPSQPTAVATADMNGDGHLDIVVGAQGTGTELAVYRNQGGGTFAAPVMLSAGQPVRSLALADLDGDGRVDVVVGTPVDVRIIAGAPSGALEAPRILAPSSGRSAGDAVDVADLDHNGRPDIVAGWSSHKGVDVYLAQATTRFAFAPAAALAAETVSVPQRSVVRVKLADVNDDGTPDILLMNGIRRMVPGDTYPGQFRVALGRGDGTFGAMVDHTTDERASDLLLVDVDGDGVRDVVGPTAWRKYCGGGERLRAAYVFRGQVDGTFAPATLVQSIGAGCDTSGLPSLVAGALVDTTGGGMPDIVFLETVRNKLERLVGPTRNAEFSTATLGLNGGTPLVTDVDNDGDSDVLSVQANGGIQMLINNGTSAIPFAQVFTSAPDAMDHVFILDQGSDGRVEIVGGGLNSSTVAVYGWNPAGVGSLEFAGRYDVKGAEPPALSQVLGMAVADFTGDSAADVLVTSSSQGRVNLRQLSGAVSTYETVDFWEDPEYPGFPGNYPGAVVAGDVDGDNLADAVVAWTTPSVVRLYRQSAGTLVLNGEFGVSQGTERLFLEDVNADGRRDLVTLTNTGSMSVYPGMGGMAFGASVDVQLPSAPRATALADVDGDLVPEALFSMAGGVELRAFQPNGTLGTAARLPFGLAAMGAFAVGEVHGDGAPEIFASPPQFMGDVGRYSTAPRLKAPYELRLSQPAITVPNGQTVSGVIPAGGYLVEGVGVRVNVSRASGSGFGGVRLALVSPRGERVYLNGTPGPTCTPGHAVPTGASWSLAYPAGLCPEFAAAMAGWQPRGDWRLEVVNNTGVALTLEDVSITLRGYSGLPVHDGRTAARPTLVTFPGTSRARRFTSSNVGHPRNFVAPCGGNGPERFFQFRAPATGMLTATASGPFDSVISIRGGACPGTDLGAGTCGDDLPGGHRSSRATASVTAAQTYCVVVDGFGVNSQGPFDVSLSIP